METIAKAFLVSTGLSIWKNKFVFSRESIRRPASCLNRNKSFLWKLTTQSFSFLLFYSAADF